ncbi:MAG: hypothetical protein ACTSW8_11300 [Candidatus Thorarchaeota archaeon]
MRHYHQTTTEFSLRMKNLVSINLTHFSRTTNLKILDVGINKIREIDLRPLLGLPAIEVINLEHNILQEINLAPLRESYTLRRLYLNNNSLEVVDISPLCSLWKLEKVMVDSSTKIVIQKDLVDRKPNLRLPKGLEKYRQRFVIV